MIKIMIADDQELIRESLQIVLWLNADFKVIGLAKNGAELLELIANDIPDVILMDVRMPEMDGVVATKEIKTRYPEVKIIILTTFDDDEYVYNALKYGASGYLLKGVSVPELVDAVHKVASGGSILNPDVTNKVVKLFNHLAQGNIAIDTAQPPNEQKSEQPLNTGKCTATDVETLSRTERNVAQLVGRGLSNKEIADRLHISSGTVRNNLSAALAKLNLRGRTQLAIWAVQTGLSSEDCAEIVAEEK